MDKRSRRRNLLKILPEKSRADHIPELAHELHIFPASTHPASTDELDSTIVLEERTMWTKPDFTEMRFGFEITMYIGNR